MSDFDARLPVRGTALDLTVEVANSAGTTIDPAKDQTVAALQVSQGSSTTGQNGTLTLGAVTTAAPAYTNGQSSPLSLTTGGALRIDNASWIGSTAPTVGQKTMANSLPVTIASDQTALAVSQSGTWNINNISGTISLPTGASTSALQTSGNASLSSIDTKTPALGQATMAASSPVVIASNQSTLPENLAQIAGTTTDVNTGNASAGTLRVVIASNQPAIPVDIGGGVVDIVQYNTASSVASNAANTHTYTPGATFNLEDIWASASGQMKIEVQWGTTGSETTKFVGFTSKGDQRCHFSLSHPVTITTAMSIKVIRTNMDNQAMDVYSTIVGH